tara:strand:+ start:18404 stop:18808 length:405 start_codon:yes stop_codon:yes gene_type:complete
MNGQRFVSNIKRQEDRIDSFWYHRDRIATIDFPNGKSISAEACGEIQVSFEEGGRTFKGDEAVEEARYNLKLTDEDLDKLNEHDGWRMNNWFAIHEFDINGECSQDDLGICHDYDSAIQMLKDVAKEKQKEYYT